MFVVVAVGFAVLITGAGVEDTDDGTGVVVVAVSTGVFVVVVMVVPGVVVATDSLMTPNGR